MWLRTWWLLVAAAIGGECAAQGGYQSKFTCIVMIYVRKPDTITHFAFRKIPVLNIQDAITTYLMPQCMDARFTA